MWTIWTKCFALRTDRSSNWNSGSARDEQHTEDPTISTRAGAWRDKVNTSVPVVVLAPPFVGHGVARSLGRLGVPVYCAHIGAISPSERSVYYRRTFAWDLSGMCRDDAVGSLLELGKRI